MRSAVVLVFLLVACSGPSHTDDSPTQEPQSLVTPSRSIEHCLSEDGRSLELELEARNHFRSLIAEGSRQPSFWSVGIVQIRSAADGSQRLLMEYGPEETLLLWSGAIDPDDCSATLETLEGKPIEGG